MNLQTQNRRSITRAVVTLAVAAGLYQAVALSGYFPQRVDADDPVHIDAR